MLADIGVIELSGFIVALSALMGVGYKVVVVPIRFRHQVDKIEQELKEVNELNVLLLSALMVILEDTQELESSETSATRKMERITIKKEIQDYLYHR